MKTTMTSLEMLESIETTKTVKFSRNDDFTVTRQLGKVILKHATRDYNGPAMGVIAVMAANARVQIKTETDRKLETLRNAGIRIAEPVHKINGIPAEFLYNA